MKNDRAKSDRISDATEKLLEMFASGELPPAVAKTVITAKQDIEIPSVKWSLGNQILMMAAGTTDARGFDQWKKAGRYVRKGAKAIYILGPCTRRITNEETGEEKTIISGFKSIPVYRYEDTEGKEIPELDYTPQEMPPLIEVAEKYGVKVQYGPATSRFYGCYKPSSNSILLCTHDVDTFFHELAHAVHGTIRQLKGGQHTDQEIVAETVSTVLCILYGYKGYVYHGYEYIRHYAQEKTGPGVIKEIMKVLADVQEVLRRILSSSAAELVHVEVA